MPSSAPSTAAATAAPSPTSPSSTAPTNAPAPTPAALSISGTAHRVDAGQTASFSGVVSAADRTPLADVRVALQRRDAEGWRRVAWATSDEEGVVLLSLPPVTESTAVRLRTRGARSDPWRVAMRPLLTLTSEASLTPDNTSAATVVITAVAQGGRAGDHVQLLVRRKTGLAVAAEAVLDAERSVRFEVRPRRAQVRYVVVLDRTDAHTAAREPITVIRP